MAEVKGSYDPHEKTWEDEDGAQLRVTEFKEDGHAVVRTVRTDTGGMFREYVDLDRDDILGLIRHLQTIVGE